MRSFGCVLTLSLLLGALPARADPGAEPDAGPSQAELADEANVPPCTPPRELEASRAPAYTTACTFFTALASRNVDGLMPTVKAPFFFEGTSVGAIDGVGHRWVQLLGDLGNGSAHFYGMQLYSYDEMVKKYGKPPAKLAKVPLRGAMIAVGDLNGRAEVVALVRQGERWAVFAFHD